MNRGKNSQGWTLLECMIVVSIIGVAALIAIPSWMAARARSQGEVCLSNQRLIFEQLNIYCLDLNKPCTIDEFPTITDVKNTLMPADSEKYVKRDNAFRCTANPDLEDFDDYRFVQDGHRIIDIQCDFEEAHNL